MVSHVLSPDESDLQCKKPWKIQILGQPVKFLSEMKFREENSNTIKCACLRYCSRSSMPRLLQEVKQAGITDK